MKVVVGNHLKMHLPHYLRERTAQFYIEILGCSRITDRLYPDVDLYEFPDGFVVGCFYYDELDTLRENDYLMATWMEIKTDDPDALKERLIKFGVSEVEFADKSRFYFQAPGGQIFRVAPMDGGL